MGSVVSINVANDRDLFDSFAELCPAVPDQIDESVGFGASAAVKSRQASTAFRNGFTFVAALCVGCLVVTFVFSAFDDSEGGAGLDRFSPETMGLSTHPWRENRASWQAHIQALERDLHYRRIVQEKRLFAERFMQQQ